MLTISRMRSLLTPTFSSFSSHLPEVTPLALFSFASKSLSCSPTTFRNPCFVPLKSAIFSSKSSFLSIQNRGVHTEVAPPSSAGEIHVIVGPMFAGKTTALLRRIQSESSNGRFGTFYNFVFCVAWLDFELEFMWVAIKCYSFWWVVLFLCQRRDL